MLRDPHYPSKWSVAIVFLVIAALMAGVFAWAFILNFGKAKFVSEINSEITINGKTLTCFSPSCEISLPPRSYRAVAKAEGFYELIREVSVVRADVSEYQLVFERIPSLQPILVSEIPSEPASIVYLKDQSLFDARHGSEKPIAIFESLQNPKLVFAGDLAVVVDSGRVFFVDLLTGSKLRKFDFSIFVRDAIISDSGKRALLFVTVEKNDRIFLYDVETDQITVLSWYEPPSFVQWDLARDNGILVISQKLQAEENNQTLSIFQVNLDTEEIRKPLSFELIPKKLLRRDDRYFVEYEKGGFQEVVVR